MPGALLLTGAGPGVTVEISFVHRPPEGLDLGRPATLEGHVLGASEVETVELFFRLDGETEWLSVELELVSGDRYRAEISEIALPASALEGAPPGTTRFLEYYVVAKDFFNATHGALASAEEPVRVPLRLPPPSPPAPKVEAARRTLRPPFAVGWEEGGLPLLSASSVTTIEGARIRSMGARNLADVLRAVPEVEIRQRSDGRLSLAVRGSGSDADVLLLLDGQRLDNRYDGRLLLTLPANLIERLVVRRGAALALHQVGALAGVIEVYTRRPDGVDLAVRGGSHLSHLTAADAERFGTYRADALGGWQLGPVALHGHLGFDVSDGAQIEVREDAFGRADNPATSSDVPGPLRDDRLGLSGGASAVLSEMVPGELTLATRYFYEERGAYLGAVDTYGPHGASDRHLLAAQALYQLPLGEIAVLGARLGFDYQQGFQRRQLTPTDFTLSDRDGDLIAETFSDGVLEEETVGTSGGFAEVATTFALPLDQQLIVGLLGAYHDVGEPLVLRNIDSLGVAHELREVESPELLVEDRGRFVLGVYAADVWAVHEMLDLLVGLRFVWVDDLDELEAQKAIGPRLALAFRPLEPLTLRLQYGSSFRPPTQRELTDRSVETLPEPLQSGRYVGDPRLQAANQHVVELSVTYASEHRGWGYEATAGAYYAHLFDGIAALPDTGDADPYLQIADRNQFGLSAEGSLTFNSRLRLYVAGWWHRITEPDADGEDTPLTAVPQIGALIGMWVNVLDILEVSLVARYASERRNNGRTVLELTRTYRIPATVTVDGKIQSTPIADLVRVGVSAHNLLDVDNRDPAERPDLIPDGIPRPGLTLLATVELLFDPASDEATGEEEP